MERKLASIRTITDIQPIDGADAIEVAAVGGWKVVVKKGEFRPGDLCIYCEVDSFLPIRDEFEFLRKSSYKKMKDGSEGFRLRTAKIRGQISQGLLLPITMLVSTLYKGSITIQEGEDVTERLGITKYEPPIPAELAGKVKGLFPSFIRKTEEIRIQNLTKEFDLWKTQSHRFYVTEKCEGCLDENTLVETDRGISTIKEVCENNYDGKVKSFNIETGKVEYHKIKNTFIKQPENHEWFEIVLEDGTKIKLTGNHRVWLPELLCWRKVEDLSGDEVFLLKK